MKPPKVSRKRRSLLIASSVTGALGAVVATVPFVKYMLPSAKSRSAGAPVQVDLGPIDTGTQVTIEWRGKPVWVLHRTPSMLETLPKLDPRLRDPASGVASQQPDYAQNSVRAIKPDYFVCIALCTHLGCVPNFRPDRAPEDLGKQWLGGYFCPCHGSKFDLAGRVYKGVPAPTNLVIPPHRYVDDSHIIIGED